MTSIERKREGREKETERERKRQRGGGKEGGREEDNVKECVMGAKCKSCLMKS